MCPLLIHACDLGQLLAVHLAAHMAAVRCTQHPVAAECAWCLQGLTWSGVSGVHEELLQSYLASGQELAEVPDDGYFMQNVGHHLIAAKRFRDLEKLLTNAAWLESKLHSYGVASVVADYRRCRQLLQCMQGSPCNPILLLLSLPNLFTNTGLP